MLDDSSLDFATSIDNGNSNTYDQIARTNGNINFLYLFKALKEDDKKVLRRAETLVKALITLEALIHQEMTHHCIF